MNTHVRALAVSFVCFVSGSVWAQTTCPAWRSGFGIPGADGSVRALASFDDGSGPALFVGGSFGSAGEVNAQHIARWNGTTWSAVGGGCNGDVLCLAVLNDGSGDALYAGGSFTTAGGVLVNGVAKWNGSSWSPLGIGVAGGSPTDVRALCAYDDGTGPAIYAGGRFVTAGGITVNNIARWKNGAWSAVSGGVINPSFASNVDVDALAVYDDGSGSSLFVGGYFGHAGALTALGIARWNGAHWSALTVDTAVTVHAFAVWDDGTGPSLYVGMDSGEGSGSSLQGIGRWNGNWSALGDGMEIDTGASGRVLSLTVHDDGTTTSLIAGGAFFFANTVPAHCLARFDGQHWTSLSSTISVYVRALASWNDGTGAAVFVGGDFTTADGTSAPHITRRDANGFNPVGSGNGITGDGYPYGNVGCFTTFGSGSAARLIAGGAFANAGGVVANNIAAFDGATWTPLGAGTVGEIVALAVFDEGHGAGPVLFAGGHITVAGSVAANFIARWDGSAWSTVGGGTNGLVDSLAVFDDGSGTALYVAGQFSSAGSGAVNGSVARWNGTSWSNVGTPPSGVLGIVTFDDGTGPALYGYANIQPPPGFTSKVYRWNGSSWSQVGATLDDFVGRLYVHDFGGHPLLYAGMVGYAATVMNRWDGSTWTPMAGLGNGADAVQIRSMATFDEGLGNAPSLIVGGGFSTAEGLPAVNLARWDGAHWSAVDASFGSLYSITGVYALATFADPVAGGTALFAGGDFTTGYGAPSTGIAERTRCYGATNPYCFGDGSLTVECPCANFGAAGHGCANSSVAAGAQLGASGTPSLAADTLTLTQTDSLAHAFTIVLQGNATVAGGVVFGDGLRCAGGSLKRLYTASATAGILVVPGPSDPTISSRSAALGDPLAPGSVRYYQAYYRDPVLTFCPAPQGKAFNVGNGVRATWMQ
jgi:hypothetical protein